MKKVIIFGCGLIGYTIAKEIITSWDIDKLVVVDNLESNLQKLEKLKGMKNANDRAISIEALRKSVVSDRDYLIETAKGSIVGIGSLPHSVSANAIDICIEARINFVDLVYDSHLRNVREVDERARNAGVTLVTSMGVAPGLSNAMVANSASKFDDVESVKIYVGGVPTKKIAPLDYQIVFSAMSVVNEYIKEVHLRRGKENLTMPAMSEVENVSFFSYDGGDFEAFLTDGLSTLLDSFPEIPDMEEKTVRWKGHTEKMNFLRDLGILSPDKLSMSENCEIMPSEILARLMNEKLKMKEGDQDMTLMKVEVSGMMKGEKVRHIQELFDVYDEKESETSMARTTGFTCVIVAEMLASGMIKQHGFLPPEKAVRDEVFESLVSRLNMKNVYISETMVKYPVNSRRS